MSAIVQTVARFDHAVVVLTAAGELFGQVRGQWEPIAGIAGQRIVSIAAKPSGLLVAVLRDGRIFEQRPDSGNSSGTYSASWHPLPPLPDTPL